MGLQFIRVSLRGSAGVEAPTGDEFFSALGTASVSAFDLAPSTSAWQAALIHLFAVQMADVKAFEEPFEEFATRVNNGFLRAAAFLAECESAGLAAWRRQGRKADIAISGWLANEQLDLSFPAVFLAQCGRLDLSIAICTNG